MALVRWGLMPGWVKDPRAFKMLINARAESAAEKPSFCAAMRHRRYLVPADGFYEWKDAPGAKRPHLSDRGRGDLWRSRGYSNAGSGPMAAVAILSAPANAAMSGLSFR
jgi:putative SOS response-associated peptidase YedK